MNKKDISRAIFSSWVKRRLKVRKEGRANPIAQTEISQAVREFTQARAEHDPSNGGVIIGMKVSRDGAALQCDSMKYIVEVNWDDHAHKWVVSSPNVKGLAGEASTIEEALVGAANDIDWLLNANEPSRTSTSSVCEVNPKPS